MTTRVFLHRSGLLLALFGLTLGLSISASLRGADSTSNGSSSVVTDGVGRQLSLHGEPQRIYVTSPIGLMMIYALAPEKLVGWNYKMGPRELSYIQPEYRNLPVLGGWFGENGKGNQETLLKAHPDFILSVGHSDQTSIEFGERLQAQVNIPVAVFSGLLADTPAAFEQLGRILHREKRAAELAAYARKTLALGEAFRKARAGKPALRVYYAEGLRGLQTDTAGSQHAELLDFLGLTNVANGPATSGFGRVSVSLEQVIAWAPDAILVCPERGGASDAPEAEWVHGEEWKQVKAVGKNAVYLIPGEPFNWFDRPPSAARLLGMEWLIWRLCPAEATFDMTEETRQFYRLFYHYEMSEKQAADLLAHTQLKP